MENLVTNLEEYLTPVTIEEAVSLLTKYGEQAKIIAGGTDILIQMRKKLIGPRFLVDISRIKNLEQIEVNNGRLSIGALTTLNNVADSKLVKDRADILAEAARQIASPGIRNLATIGGNLCNATPSADTAPPLLALEANICIADGNEEKSYSLNDFFLDVNKTMLKPNEILIKIQLPLQANSGCAFLKMRRTALDIALVNCAVKITLEESVGAVCKEVIIAIGAVAPTPMRAVEAESNLRGKKLEEDTIKKVAMIASNEVKPITDIRASAEYRKKIVQVLVRRCLETAYNKARAG